jgi:hypothetical protein
MSAIERSRLTRLHELEEMVRGLTLTALKLRPGSERRDSLVEIGSFRERVVAMRQSEVALARYKTDQPK